MKNFYLSIATRTCMRPGFLKDNIESVKSQSDNDIEQVFIVDRSKKGIQWADRALHENRKRMNGEWSFILDDDCWLTDTEFVSKLRLFTKENPQANLIMFRSKRPKGPPSDQTVFPTREVWGKMPKHQTTNCLCYAIRTPIWKQHILHFGTHDWGGDWHFLEAVLKAGHKPFWMEGPPIAESRQLGRGKLFEPAQPGWFERVATQEGLADLGKDDWRLQLWKDCECGNAK